MTANQLDDKRVFVGINALMIHTKLPLSRDSIVSAWAVLINTYLRKVTVCLSYERPKCNAAVP